MTRFTIECARAGLKDSNPRAFEGSEGKFRLKGLANGEWQFVASTEVHGRSAPTVVSLPSEKDDLVLVIPRSGAITGFVFGQGGRPVSDAEILLLYAGERQSFSIGPRLQPRAKSEPSGAYSVEGVLPGTVKLMARHPDYCDSEWMEVVVAPGALVQGVDIALPQGGRIEGLVEFSLGDVADREIGLFSSRGTMGWRDARTDKVGRFMIEHVMPQKYVIELRAPEYGKKDFANQPGMRKNIAVAEGETTHVVFGELRREITIQGVVTAAGVPAAGMSIHPYPKEGEDLGADFATRRDGSFEFMVNGAGDYKFRISASNASYAFFERAVPDQDHVELSFEVPGGSISGVILNQDGQRLGHVPITAVRNGYTKDNFADSYQRMKTQSDGSFRFDLLAPGTYTLRAPDGYQSDSPPPRVPNGRVVRSDLVVDVAEVSDIELRLPPECRISGVVIDARGNPVTNARVGALDDRGLSLAALGWEARTDATGHFQIDNVMPGTCLISARSGEKEGKSEPFEVEVGKTATVRVEIK